MPRGRFVSFSKADRKRTSPTEKLDVDLQHDLFSPLSSLYNPEPTNYKGSLQWPHENKGPSRPQVNPSYRPFGSLERNAAAAASQPIQRPTVEQVQEIQRTNMSLKDRVKSVSLLDRLGSNGARARPSSSSASSRPPREQPDLFSRQTKPQERPGSSRMRSESSMDVDMQPATAAPSAPAPPRGTKVTVANLVDGTTAEDVRVCVQFRFKAGTETDRPVDCSQLFWTYSGVQHQRAQPPRSSNSISCIPRATACPSCSRSAAVRYKDGLIIEQPKLIILASHSGALADGQTLQVRIVRPDPPTAPRAVRGQASRQGSGKSRSSEQPAQVSSQPQQTKELFPTEG